MKIEFRKMVANVDNKKSPIDGVIKPWIWKTIAVKERKDGPSLLSSIRFASDTGEKLANGRTRITITIFNSREEVETALSKIYEVQRVSPSNKNEWEDAIKTNLPFVDKDVWDINSTDFQAELWWVSETLEECLSHTDAINFSWHRIDNHQPSNWMFFPPLK